jgi:hypothetical protein
MTAPTLCAAPIQGTRMRIIKLDTCGVPVTGAGSQIVTDGFVQVAVSQQYEDGTEYQLRNAAGAFCVNDGPTSSLVQRWTSSSARWIPTS